MKGVYRFRCETEFVAFEIGQDQMRMPLTFAVALMLLAPASANATDMSAESVAKPCVPQATLDMYIKLRNDRHVDQWRVNPPADTDIAFLGSSIVAEGPWAPLFPEYDVTNRGIGADTTTGVLARLDEVIALDPETVMLYIGGNDLGRHGDEPEAVAGRIETILAELSSGLPQSRIILATIFPRDAVLAPKIAALNALLTALPLPENTVIADGSQLFATTEGTMNPSYSNDMVHLNGEAYRMWAGLLRGFVASN